MNLENYLNSKPLYYDKIDYDVIAKAWDILKSHIKLPYIIHIVGTNGKGSTGRYLAHILANNNYKTLHYSSPHILKFNERIWIDKDDSTDTQLDFAHNKLQDILPNNICQKLTYFEYTTLIAFLLSHNLDYLVLEAGLGGEFDATNVVPNDLTLITTIGLDHIEFLGNTIEKIASTKMRSCDSKFILGVQVSKIEVDIAKKEVLNDKEEIELITNISKINEAILLPKYLQNNLKIVMTTLDYLNLNIKDYSLPILFGRCQKIDENITIDVGHNSLASSVLLREFSKKNSQKIILVYNSYKDKNYQEVLQILKPIVEEVQIINIDDDRIVETDKLINVCNDLGIVVKEYVKIELEKQYLVFGSFKVVEEFIKSYKDSSER